MSKYFQITDDGALDYRYKDISYEHVCIYAFYIGDILIGTIHKMGKDWSVVSHKTPHDLCPLDGFRTRHKAARCLLKMNGYK